MARCRTNRSRPSPRRIPVRQEAVDALVAAALDAGGTDNITVIVADMPLTEPEHHAFSAFRLDEGEDIGAIEDATLQTLRTIRSA